MGFPGNFFYNCKRYKLTLLTETLMITMLYVIENELYLTVTKK